MLRHCNTVLELRIEGIIIDQRYKIYHSKAVCSLYASNCIGILILTAQYKDRTKRIIIIKDMKSPI